MKENNEGNNEENCKEKNKKNEGEKEKIRWRRGKIIENSGIFWFNKWD